jgi:hypothetical protein
MPGPRLRLERRRTASEDVIRVYFLGEAFATVVHVRADDGRLLSLGFDLLSRRLSRLTRSQRDVAFAEVAANLAASLPADDKRRYQALFFERLRLALVPLPVSLPIDVSV